MIRTEEVPSWVSWRDIGATRVAECRSRRFNPALPPVMFFHGITHTPPWADLSAWTTMGPFPSMIRAVLASGRRVLVPWSGPCVGMDDATYGLPGTALNGLRDVIGWAGGSVDAITFSGGAINAIRLDMTNPGSVTSVTMLSPGMDLVAVSEAGHDEQGVIRKAWCGDVTAPVETLTAAVTAGGCDLESLKQFSLGDRCMVVSGTNEWPAIRSGLTGWADATGVPLGNRFLNGPGNHFDAAIVDPLWDDVMPLRSMAQPA